MLAEGSGQRSQTVAAVWPTKFGKESASFKWVAAHLGKEGRGRRNKGYLEGEKEEEEEGQGEGGGERRYHVIQLYVK